MPRILVVEIGEAAGTGSQSSASLHVQKNWILVRFLKEDMVDMVSFDLPRLFWFNEVWELVRVVFILIEA